MSHDPPTQHRTRRNLLRATAFLALVAALALLPPYINGERYRHRIAEAMSQGLGRPVHIDTVSFHLLPTVGITLGGLVVDENPAFGNEPVIRANVVEATLRLSSLWRRQIEISRLSFGVDANGSGPSVNIVRNAEGRWNLQDILTQAAHASTAPTSQTRHGSAPRFPYIEATGARINLKLGNEKMPFSLTDADFALWLASPQQWQVRLKATPLRTDTNASDTGNITVEGTLGRAATLAGVPLQLTASWAHVPLGEATRILTGVDQQWRGTLDAGATLAGTVGAAQLDTTVHLTDLRRADFVPTKLLDVSAHCTAAADIAAARLTQAACSVPDGGPQPVRLTAPAVDLQAPATTALNVAFEQMSANWLLDWARLVTQQIPDMHVVGTIDGGLQYSAAATGPTPAAAVGWQGSLTAVLQSVTRNGITQDFSAKPVTLHTELRSDPSTLATLTLDPVTVRLASAQASESQAAVSQTATAQTATGFGTPPQLVLAGSADATHIALRFTGAASPEQLRAFASGLFTPLGNDAASAVKAPTPTTVVPIDIACTHPYSDAETCQQVQAAVTKSRPRRRR
jgi:hypothetical protein